MVETRAARNGHAQDAWLLPDQLTILQAAANQLRDENKTLLEELKSV